MTRRRRRQLTRDDQVVAIAAICLFAGAWLLDAVRDARLIDAPPVIVVASLFSVIWAGLQAIAGWLATGATITVSYLATVVSWLAGRVATFLLSTGAVFARVWDGLKIVWNDVLKPALLWVDDHLKRLHDWLQRTFRPILDWLNAVRDRLFDLYRKFVRPVLDTIDFIRQVNRVLNAFGIHVLDALDRALADVQQFIVDNFYFLLRQINKVQDVIDRIVDLDGFFRRYALIASLRKYSPEWIAHFWRDQVKPGGATGATGASGVVGEPRKPDDDIAALGEYLTTGGGELAGIVEELGADVMRIAETPSAGG